MINPKIIEYIFSSASIQRWNDYPRMVDLVELDKQAHKFIIAYFIAKLEDDINFTNYSSQGQKRAASVSLKVSEIDIIENISGKKSVILVDDIFSELDEKRRNNMIDSIKNKGQIIFTMVSFNKIEDLSKDYKIFEVNKGKLKVLK